MSTTPGNVRCTITLARTHKLQERLSAKMRKLQEDIAGFCPTTSFSRAPTDDQARQLREQRDRVVASTNLYIQCSYALGGLRAAVGRVNAQAGVSDLLAKIEAKKRAVQTLERLRDVYGRVGVTAVQVDAAATYAWPVQGEEYGAQVACTAIRSDDLDSLNLRIAELERDIFVAQDQLADLNAAKIDLEFGAGVAEILGLLA